MPWREQLAVVSPIVLDAGSKEKRAEQLPRLIFAFGTLPLPPPDESLTAYGLGETTFSHLHPIIEPPATILRCRVGGPLVLLFLFIRLMMGSPFFSTQRYLGSPGDTPMYMWFLIL